MRYEFEKTSLWQRWRAFWVNEIKIRAIRLLNRTEEGELFLLKMYFLAEKGAVVGINEQLQEISMPAWLQASMKTHLQEEGQHIQLFADAIRARGKTPPNLEKSTFMDWVKLRPWFKLSKHYQTQFKHGELIPAYVIGECAEYMVIRVLTRHQQSLPNAHPLKAMLQGILADEARHLEECYAILDRLVSKEEQPVLDQLRKKVYRVDFSWGITTAIAQYLIALYFNARRIFGLAK